MAQPVRRHLGSWPCWISISVAIWPEHIRSHLVSRLHLGYTSMPALTQSHLGSIYPLPCWLKLCSAMFAQPIFFELLPVMIAALTWPSYSDNWSHSHSHSGSRSLSRSHSPPCYPCHPALPSHPCHSSLSGYFVTRVTPVTLVTLVTLVYLVLHPRTSS